ncbi:MAG: hypothetical protein KatS3mg110_1241 [Pirellulaceae bacterium]|nr:MAG: hypothetical protein KatS3mg110_1241 [Pirellulaceae bacterium]
MDGLYLLPAQKKPALSDHVNAAFRAQSCCFAPNNCPSEVFCDKKQEYTGHR